MHFGFILRFLNMLDLDFHEIWKIVFVSLQVIFSPISFTSFPSGIFINPMMGYLLLYYRQTKLFLFDFWHFFTNYILI